MSKTKHELRRLTRELAEAAKALHWTLDTPSASSADEYRSMQRLTVAVLAFYDYMQEHDGARHG